MSLGDLDAEDRQRIAPGDLLTAVQHIIDAHAPIWEDNGWTGEWICRECDSRLTGAEKRTHVAYRIWERGYLQVP